MILSACIICKNEENLIEDALKSIVNVVDEIIIVDTGSSDNTVNICKKYTDKIYNYNWEDDFSKARNYSISKANGDWILVIDADERLEFISKNILKNILENSIYNGYCLVSSNEKGESTFPICRLFKNKKEYRFNNRLHEQIVHSIEKDRVGMLNLMLNHLGYDDENLKDNKKIDRNLEILSNYKDEEKDCFYYYSLGNALMIKEDFLSAKIAYLDALSIYEDNYGFTYNLIGNLKEVYLLLNEFDEAKKLKEYFSFIE